MPTDLLQVADRQKDIQYSSRTRMVTTTMREEQEYGRLLLEVLARVPEAERTGSWYERATALSCGARRNVVHLIYRNKPYEGYAKDYQFSQVTMSEHWSSGHSDIRATLEHPECLAMPGGERPFVTHDLHGTSRA